jgi:hypothetical protein
MSVKRQNIAEQGRNDRSVFNAMSWVAITVLLNLAFKQLLWRCRVVFKAGLFCS